MKVNVKYLNDDQHYKLYINNFNDIDNKDNIIYISCDNQLITIEGIDKLPNLQYLNCNYNKLTSLKGIDKLPNLQYLCCRNNKLITLEGIDKLPNLEYFDCYNNQLIYYWKKFGCYRKYIKQYKYKNMIYNLLNYNQVIEKIEILLI